MGGGVSSEARVCSRCRLLDFGAVGIQGFDYDDTLEEISDQPILKVVKRAKKCFFCRMVIDYLDSWAEREYGGIQRIALEDDGARISIRYHDLFSVEDDESANGDSKHVVRVSVDYFVRTRADSSRWIGPQMCFQKCLAEPMTVEQTCGMYPVNGWPEAEPYAARLRPIVADCRLFKKWKDSCADQHGADLCRAHYKDQPLDFIRLIDTRHACLVEFTAHEIKTGGITWAALSYVWGTRKFATLTQATLENYREPGALTGNTVPDTIFDAIFVARNIDENYLWVDSLCIIQDSQEDKQMFIRQMDAIYHLASLTIVNSAGNDAYHGLPGMRASSNRRVQNPFRLGGVDIVQTLDPPGNGHDLGLLAGCSWTTRGWTFQEGLLSRRLLIFTEQQVYWQCSATTWCEDGCWEVDNATGAPRVHREALADIEVANLWSPEVDKFEKNYRIVVQRYSERKLTNQGDGLNAFAGIATALERAATSATTTRRFIWGMPEEFLGAALTWPCRRDGMQRRTDRCMVDSSGGGGGGAVSVPFPSWAWVGWIGPVYYSEVFGYLDCQHAGLVFHVLDSEGLVRALPQNKRFRPYKSFVQAPKEMEPLHQWKGKITEVDSGDIHERLKQAEIAPTVLAFHTSYAQLEIGPYKTAMAAIASQQAQPTPYEQPPVLCRRGRDLKPVWFQRPEFSNALPRVAKFVVIGRDTRESIRDETRLCILLVEEVDEVAGMAFQRVGMLHVSEKAWNEVEDKEWRLIILM